MRSAADFPDRPCLMVDGASYAYADVLERAGALARLIAREDAGGGPLGAVYADRSLWAYAGILGVLLAGRGYVPLSPSFPPERTALMLERSGVSLVVVDGGSLEGAGLALAFAESPFVVIAPEATAAPGWSAGSPHRVLCATELAAMRGAGTPAPSDPDETAYLLFTSGTTGAPKGIGIRQSNVAAYLEAAAERFGLGPDDRCSQNFSSTFDLSVHDMFVTWAAGACLCVPPARVAMAPARFVQEQELTSWFSTPSTAAMMLRLRMLRPGAFPSLRWSLFCGEALTAEVADAWTAAAPAAILDNLYGPTEATIACTAYRYPRRIPPDELLNGVVPIGRPFGRTRVAVVDERHEPAGTGEVGELVLGGDQLAPGYWRDPERTARAFVEIPALDPIGPWYRTGDMVSLTPGGDLVYRGRMDDQIKIRGHRVELQEVEGAIRLASGASIAVAIGWPRTPAGADGIIAFLAGVGAGDDAEILGRARRTLPDYMVPSELHRLADMPLNASGKVDRRRLFELREADA